MGSLRDLALKMQEHMGSRVVIRARQYPEEYGRIVSMGRSNSSKPNYREVTEFQLLTTLPSQVNSGIAGLITYTLPYSQRLSHDRDNQFNVVIWSPDESIEKIAAVCESWIPVPVWLGEKPEVLARQHKPGSDYIVVDPDIVFLRLLERITTIIESRALRLRAECKRKETELAICTASRLEGYVTAQVNKIAETTGIVRVTTQV